MRRGGAGPDRARAGGHARRRRRRGASSAGLPRARAPRARRPIPRRRARARPGWFSGWTCSRRRWAARRRRDFRERGRDQAGARGRELGDPGNVPGTAAGRLADALLDAYDALPVSSDAGSARGSRVCRVRVRSSRHERRRRGVGTCRRARDRFRGPPRGALRGGRGDAGVAVLADAAPAAAERGDRAET